MNYLLNYNNKEITGEIVLPASKSINNRLLIIRALSGKKFKINNLSDSDDGKVMLKALESNDDLIDIGHAGTTMRFLTAFYAATAQSKIITGSERMKNRPIRELVDGLNQLGAGITYVEKEGYPPVKTSGKELSGDQLHINGSISSQFITALLLVAPSLPQGLTIHIDGKLISSSYVLLTLQLMKSFGVDAVWEDKSITIVPQFYRGHDCTVEADWSAASYWYQIASLAMKADLIIRGLSQNSFQGDAALTLLFEKLGVSSEFTDNAVHLTKTGKQTGFFEYDFINNPDLVQTFVVTLCLKNIPFRISGADTLRIKETDRIAALQIEMAKLGFTIVEPEPGVLTWDGKKATPGKHLFIDTYKDHRMALAFAPASMQYQNLVINDAMVVTKSYPNFWTDLLSVGFEVNERL
jgi:3-phosphoshikimate 1-carboxyvinyltransferase